MPVEIGRRVAGHTIITVPIGDLPGVLLERSKFLRAPVESAKTLGHERSTMERSAESADAVYAQRNGRDIGSLPELSGELILGPRLARISACPRPNPHPHASTNCASSGPCRARPSACRDRARAVDPLSAAVPCPRCS